MLWTTTLEPNMADSSSIPEKYLADDWENIYIRPSRSCDGRCCCYICGYKFFAHFSARPRHSFGPYDRRYMRFDHKRISQIEGIEESSLPRTMPKGWWAFQRMILYHQKDSTYHISDVDMIRFPREDALTTIKGSVTLKMRGETVRIRPAVYRPVKSICSSDEWVGYVVHGRCWEILSYHALGAAVKNDLALVLAALRHRRMIMGTQCKPWKITQYREGKAPIQNWFLRILTKDLPILDPVRTRCVKEVVFVALLQASRRKPKKEPSRPCRPKAARSIVCKLPMEVIYMIFDYIPSQTVVDVEKALGFYLSNTFWHSRISADLFFEIQGLTDEDVDWKRLCLKLERRQENSEALRVRKYLLNCLDKILSVVDMFKDEETPFIVS